MKDVEREIQSECHPLHVHATKSSRNVVQLKWRRKNMLNEADVIGRHGNNGNNKLWQEAKAQWSWALGDISNFLCDFFYICCWPGGIAPFVVRSLARSLRQVELSWKSFINVCDIKALLLLCCSLFCEGESRKKKETVNLMEYSLANDGLTSLGMKSAGEKEGKKSKENSLFICPCSLMSLVVVLALRIKRDDEWKIGRGKVSRWSTFKTPK